MKLTTAFFLAPVVAIAFSSAAFAQTKPAKPAIASTLPAHWDEIDQRFVFLTVQLASSETSLDAVNKALKVAGYHQKAQQQQQAVLHEKGNEQMDRNGGGPVRWDQFYGKTAAQFFRSADAGFIVDDDTSLTVVTVQSGSGQRPPQFDYIYRANQNAQARAQEEVAKLGGQIDALLERRRQLELEQAATWAKIAFQAVESHKLEAKPTYRFVLNVDGDDALSKQRQTAVRAAADFMRETLRAVADAEDAVENDPAGTFDALHRVVAASASDFNDKVLHCPKLALDAGDASTSIGRVAASSQRLADVTKNITDSYHSAMEGDQSSDDQQKQTFRAYTQQALFDCATNVFTTSQYVTALAREWKAEIDVNKPQHDLPPSAVAKASSSADAKPQTAAGASAVAANNAAVPGTSAAKPPIKLTRNLPQYLIATGTFAADAEGIRPAKKTVVATRSPDFLNKDFVFDVYLTIPKRDNDDSIIVGLGDLTDKGSVRIAIHREGGWGERAFLLPATNEHELIMGDIHEGEPYVVRIERHGSPLTVSIGSMNNGQFVAEMTQTVPDLKDFAPDVSDKRAHLYFTGEGLFSQVRLVSGTAASAVATPAHTATPSADAASGAAQPSAAVDADAAKGIYLLNTDKLPAPFTATGTFSITLEGLKCYDTKSLIITHDKDFLSKDFIFEATVDVPDKLDRDEIIIGLGDGTEKGSLRMIIRVEGGWPKRDLHLGEREGKNFGDIRDAGVRILRIERHGNAVTTSVGTEKDGKFDAEMSQTVADAKTAVPELSERYAHLFFTGKPPWSKIRLVTGAAASEPAPAPTQPDQAKKPGRKKR